MQIAHLDRVSMQHATRVLKQTESDEIKLFLWTWVPRKWCKYRFCNCIKLVVDWQGTFTVVNADDSVYF